MGGYRGGGVVACSHANNMLPTHQQEYLQTTFSVYTSLNQLEAWQEVAMNFLRMKSGVAMTSLMRSRTTTFIRPLMSLEGRRKQHSSQRDVHTFLKESQAIPGREEQILKLKSNEEFDILVIGGGATGSGKHQIPAGDRID